MKRKLFLGALLLLSTNSLFFSSCSDEENHPPAPTVKLTELGSGHDAPNDKIAYAGSAAHIEATITADGLIREIAVEVHQEDGNFKFNKVYTDSKYVGAKNTTFHEHLPIPSEAPAGEYHLHLVVKDRNGETATAESALTIKVKPAEDDHDHDHDHDHGHTH